MSIKMLDLIGVGEICIDWILKVDRFPKVDEKIFIKESKKFPGGVTANFVVGFARLGGKPGFIGGIGKDEYGEFLLGILNSEGIDTSYMKIHENKTTAINFIIIDTKGNKVIYQDPLLKENVPDPNYFNIIIEDYIKKAKVLHTTAIKLDTSIKVAEIAKKHDLVVSFDLEKHVVDDYGLERLKPLLKLTDILMPNKLAIKTLMNREDLIESAKELINFGPKMIVITLGKKGSIVVTEKEVIETPAFKIIPVDTTGAGDTFNAAFIYSHIIKGLDIEKSSIIANAAAALKCLKLGAQAGMPKIHELKDFLKNYNYHIDI